MLVGKYLQFALIGSALASFATAEESKLRKGGRKLNRKNRGYTHGTGTTSAPIDNSEPLPTLSPTIEPTFYPTLSPTLSPAADIESPTLNPTLSPTLNPTKSPVWKADGWKADGYPTLSPTLNPTLSPVSDILSPTLSPTLAPTWSPTVSPTDLEPISADPTKSPVWKADGWKADGYPTLNPTLSPTLNPTESVDPEKTPDPTLSPTLSPTFAPSEYSCGDSWHRSTSALNPDSCTNDKNIPANPSRLYDTVQECCKAEFGKVAGCQVYNVCGPKTPGPASNLVRKPSPRPTNRQK